jgi:hypothetical protein
MPLFIFRSTDTGLAGIQGSAAGTLITAFDAMLVNGVNSSSTGWSASWAGGVATYSKTAHGMPLGPGLVLTISGFSPAGYNGTAVQCVATDANTITRSIADPSGTPATGTATVLRSPLSVSGTAWTKEFSGTNLATYKQPAGTNGFRWAVDDTTTIVKNLKHRGFESMTAAGPAAANGTNPFPTDVQVAASGYWHQKSSTNDTTTRPWVLFSNGKIFYFFSQYSSVNTTGNGFIFGDFTSYKSGDTYNTVCIGDTAIDVTTTSIRIGNCNSTSLAFSTGHYFARSYTGAGTSKDCGKGANTLFTQNASEIGTGGMTYPSGVEGGMILSPIWLHEGGVNGVRGHLPGLWCPCHPRPLTHGDTFSGASSTPLAGKTFEVYNVASAAQFVIETSDTWDQ